MSITPKKLNYEIIVPKNIANILTPPLRNLPQSVSTTGFANSTLSSGARGCCGGFSLCAEITKIGHRVYNAIYFCYSKIYTVFTGRSLSFPLINFNLSKEHLTMIYWGLGPEHKWREGIDGRYHYMNNKFVFDQGAHGGTVEPGYIKSIEETFTFVEKFLNLKIDADWYLLLHKHTAAHFNGDPNIYLMGQEKVGVFRGSDDAIEWNNMSGVYFPRPEALAEFQALDADLKREFGETYGLGTITFMDASHQAMKITYKPMSRDQVRQIFNKFLNDFYQEIDRAKTPDEKLWAIAKLHQRLEWLHPVRDGSSRTNIALMNKFLTDYGFHPALLEYPHVSSTYGLKEWKAYLQNGLIKWEQEKARLKP